MKYCAEQNIPVIAYSPLTKGLFTGSIKGSKDLTDKRALFNQLQDDAMEDIENSLQNFSVEAYRHTAAMESTLYR